ncbi:HdeD family acid-resistance protein [Methyloferula stellata]|uniref:HdeD family acid-resistance protein n=1 Tax=Methyloferula stellata TaxID=876270 RepID=UPI0003753C34|nr:HdeD family acid-resistance protein [Methyloferula stellata]
MTSTDKFESAAPWSAITFDEIHRDLSRNWWAVGLRGIFGILFGLVAFFMPAVTMLSLVLVFAVYLLVDGVFAIVASVQEARRGRPWGWLTVEGIVDILTATAVTTWPGETVLIFVLLVAAWALVSGGFMIAAAVRLRQDHGRWWLLAGGIVSVLYGILLVIAPIIGAIVLTWWLGAYAMAFGFFLLGLAFQLRSQHKKATAPGAAPEAAHSA